MADETRTVKLRAVVLSIHSDTPEVELAPDERLVTIQAAGPGLCVWIADDRWDGIAVVEQADVCRATMDYY